MQTDKQPYIRQLFKPASTQKRNIDSKSISQTNTKLNNHPDKQLNTQARIHKRELIPNRTYIYSHKHLTTQTDRHPGY